MKLFPMGQHTHSATTTYTPLYFSPNPIYEFHSIEIKYYQIPYHFCVQKLL